MVTTYDIHAEIIFRVDSPDMQQAINKAFKILKEDLGCNSTFDIKYIKVDEHMY